MTLGGLFGGVSDAFTRLLRGGVSRFDRSDEREFLPAALEILDHLTLSYEFPNGIHVNFEANQISPAGFRRVGEEFTGTTGLLETSRGRMVHHKSAKDIETMESKRDITNDAIEAFLGRVESGDVENVAERSAVSTLFAILGRTAIYENREAVWKTEFGDIGA